MPISTDSGPLQVERMADGRRRLLRPLTYKVDGVDKPITVPAGFKTDFSSDPIGLLDWSKVDVAGVVHDYLYQRPQEIGCRWREDVIWYKIARSGKWRTSLLPACLGFLGLVLFGWLFRKGGHRVTRGIGVSVLVLTALGAIYEMVGCFYPEPSGSMVQVVVCMLLASANLRALVSWRRSRQRERVQRLEAVASREA